MSILTNATEARTRLIAMCAATSDPALDTTQAAAVKATGGITVVSRPADGDTLTVGGKVYTFVSSGPVGDQIVSSASNNTTAANTLIKINADTATTLCTATRNNAALTLLANTAGIAGNSLDLESSATHITVSAFTGGAAAITEDDISRILDQNAVASVWVASTDYVYGDVVIPTDDNRNGHRFVCIVAGTSDATEPSWPTWDNATVSDGDNLTWQECGPEIDLWDLIAAACAAYDLKIAKAACRFDYDVAGDSRKRSQVMQQLERQRARYAPVFVI